jgi:hypothetical protein
MMEEVKDSVIVSARLRPFLNGWFGSEHGLLRVSTERAVADMNNAGKEGQENV